jgi:hypothetical protein
LGRFVTAGHGGRHHNTRPEASVLTPLAVEGFVQYAG